MCPVPPVSVPIDIDVDSTDEELVLFLGRRRIGDPIPANVITEVNPFSIDPRNFPEKIWFLYNSKDVQSHNKGNIIKVTNGYWISMDDLRISTSTPIVGRKTIREFYLGQAPSGDRTGWMMHEYCSEQIAALGINTLKDNSTLCRFFLQDDEMLDNEEQYDLVSPGDAGGENEVSVLPSLLEKERNSSLKDTANRCQVVVGNAQRQAESPSIPLQDLANDNSIESVQTGYDFSKEDFLELEDLYDPESSSSSSDNSTIMSMNSDECFDAEALLRDIENEGGLDMEEHVDCRFNVVTSVRSDQVVIQPPPPAFGIKCNPVVINDATASSIPAPNHVLSSSSAVGLKSNGDASASGSSGGSHGSASSSGSSQGSKPVRRMAKLRNKYCCFGSF